MRGSWPAWIGRNPPCRLPPAHQGLKIWCAGREWSSSVIAAGGPSPAGDKPPRYIFSLRARDGTWVSRIRVRDMLSYQSLMPAGAGAPRYENRCDPHLPWIPSCARITMAMQRPHKRMKMVGHRVFSNCMAVLPVPSPFWIPAFAGMTRWVAGIYPGSESGTCFRAKPRIEKEEC